MQERTIVVLEARRIRLIVQPHDLRVSLSHRRISQLFRDSGSKLWRLNRTWDLEARVVYRVAFGKRMKTSTDCFRVIIPPTEVGGWFKSFLHILS